MARRKEILHSVKHFLIGTALTLKGADKIGHHPLIGSIILLFGLIILVYFFYLLIKKHPSEKLGHIVHWFEAIASLFTAYIFFQEGATYLPWAFLLASIGFFISIYVEHRKAKHADPEVQQGAS
jgi:hypothetical protein